MDCSAVLDHYLVLQALSVRDRAVDAACKVKSFRDSILAYQQPGVTSYRNPGADFWCEKWKTQVYKDGTSQDFTTCKRSNSLTVCLHRSGTHHLPTYREQVQLRASFNFPALSTRNMTMQYAHGVSINNITVLGDVRDSQQDRMQKKVLVVEDDHPEKKTGALLRKREAPPPISSPATSC